MKGFPVMMDLPEDSYLLMGSLTERIQKYN